MSASRRERLPYCNDDDVGSGHCARTHVPTIYMIIQLRSTGEQLTATDITKYKLGKYIV